MPEAEHRLALFVDFENLALGFQNTRKRFEIEKVLDRLLTKGKILVKKAYADWTRFGDYRRELHECSIELIEIPKRSQVGKNSADIRLVVDALDLCYSKDHIDSFCILSGDSDFSPLVGKLRENGKHVIGVGMKTSTSSLLIDGCDEFIFYEDIERNIAASAATAVVTTGDPHDRKAEALQLMMDTVVALKRENKDILWSSLVKDTMKRRKPQFDESYHGYKTFGQLLEDAQRRGLIKLHIDARSGTYVISLPGDSVPKAEPQRLPFNADTSHGRDGHGPRHAEPARTHVAEAGTPRVVPAAIVPPPLPPAALLITPAAPVAPVVEPARATEVPVSDPASADTAVTEVLPVATNGNGNGNGEGLVPAPVTNGGAPVKAGVRRRGRRGGRGRTRPAAAAEGAEGRPVRPPRKRGGRGRSGGSAGGGGGAPGGGSPMTS